MIGRGFQRPQVAPAPTATTTRIVEGRHVHDLRPPGCRRGGGHPPDRERERWVNVGSAASPAPTGPGRQRRRDHQPGQSSTSAPAITSAGQPTESGNGDVERRTRPILDPVVTGTLYVKNADDLDGPHAGHVLRGRRHAHRSPQRWSCSRSPTTTCTRSASTWTTSATAVSSFDAQLGRQGQGGRPEVADRQPTTG